MVIFKRLLVVTGIMLLILFVGGTGYQWQQSRADRVRFPAPGKLVEVDGLALHIDCRGSGSPTVVLEAGLTSGSASWYLVHEGMARTTRVCAYDRPGLDWSEPINRQADAREVAERLHNLLDVEGISGPKILLGMSAGGVYVREYFRNYPKDIVGMILVDSSHEQQGTRLPDLSGTMDLNFILTACSWLQPVGVIRGLRALDPIFERFDIPKDARDLMTANAYQSHSCASMLAESKSFAREINDPTGPTSLGDLPLTVLSRGREPEADDSIGLTLESAMELSVVWNNLQTELAALSTRGQRIIATESGHVIQFDQPELVVLAVTNIVDEVRR